MSRSKHTRFLVLAVLAGIVLARPALLTAQTVFCTNCGTELTQLANNLQLVDQLRRQIQLVQVSLQQFDNMTLNTQGLTSQTFSTTLAEIRRLNALLAQAKSLSFTSTDLDQRFPQKYGDYNSYVAKQGGKNDVTAKAQQWSEDTNSSVLTTLKTAALAATQIEGEEDRYLQKLERDAAAATGRMQAIQVGNLIALAGVRQTQKLRQNLLMLIQLEANAIQRMSDEKAVDAASWAKFNTPVDLPPTARK